MATPDSHPSPSSATSPVQTNLPIRRTRKQVSRACDWCRVRRIRCDNGQPCAACRRRDAPCTHKGVVDEQRTLPQALREIERLKLRVKELEAELSRYQGTSQPTPVATPDQSSSQSSPGSDLSRPSVDGTRQISTSPPTTSALSLAPKPQWVGIHVATARSEQPSYYGPASAFYFMRRVGGYLDKALQRPCAERSLQPRGASSSIHLGTTENDTRTTTTSVLRSQSMMSRVQEESFIRLFWEGYHCLIPIVDEVEFRRHYASLWEPGQPYRKQCPLVDIILAICLQYGYAYIPRADTAASPSGRDASFDDASVAGRWYYRRSQALLTADLESPTITTVQCYIFTSAYLCCASFQNMSHITAAQAIRTAQVLGLHLEPSADLPRGERELRKRIWWACWTQDAKISTKLSRPFLVDLAQVTAAMPADDLDAASYNGATLGSYGNVTWLTYSVQTQRLFLAVVDIHNSLFAKCGEVLQRDGLTCLYHDAQAVESCAKVLASSITAMKAWADSLPMEMKSQRRGGGVPYCTHSTPLDIEALAPTWLQRQRVCLELIYHSMVLNLTRPFITFHSYQGTYTPVAERHATTCVDHAVAYTLIMHQLVTETDLMSGWSEYFSLQWNAALTIVGFVLAYPIHPATPKARQALDKAVAVFDIYGAHFAVSADAATITRDLMRKADYLAGRLSNGITTASSGAEGSDADMTATTATGEWASADGSTDELAWLDPNWQENPVQVGQFMDWALSVDTFNSFEKFFDTSNPADPWAFGQA